MEDPPGVCGSTDLGGDVDISIIVAADENGVIGLGDRLPWRLAADMKHFRELTMGKPVLMSRRSSTTPSA